MLLHCPLGDDAMQIGGFRLDKRFGLDHVYADFLVVIHSIIPSIYSGSVIAIIRLLSCN